MNQSTQTTGGFSLQPQNFTEAKQLAQMISSSQLVPKSFAGKPDDCLVAMMLGAELKLNPIQSLQNISVVNGRPCVWGDAMLALCQNHGAWGGIEETFDDASMTATCRVWRKDGSANTQTYSKQDAESAQLWGKQGPWKQYPKRMLALRARGFALRNTFADALLGLVSREEADDMPQEARIISNKPTSKQQTRQLEQLPAYSEEDFSDKLPAWKNLIDSGRKTADELISFLSAKATLTDEQVQMIESLEIIESE